MVEQLNALARLWWDWSAAMFWQVGLLILVIAALDRLIRRWAWPQLRYALWSLILVKLLLPPSLSLPSGIVPGLQPVIRQALVRLESEKPVPAERRALFSLSEEMLRVPAMEPAAASVLLGPGGIVKAEGLGDGPSFDRRSHRQASLDDAARTGPSARVIWQVYAMVAAFLGTLILGIWLFLRLHSLVGRQAQEAAAASLPQSFCNQLADCASRLELRCIPRVVVTRRLATPAVFGVFRPVLLMPRGYLRRLSRRDTEHMLLHELAHIKRGDLVAHGLYLLLQIVYWYNPLLWLVRRQMHHLRELSCDATVAELLRERTTAYRQTLLETARRLLTSSVEPGLGLLGLFEDSNRLLVRLDWLTKPTWRYKTMKRVTVATIAVLMLACVLPMARAQETASNQVRHVTTHEDAQLSQQIAELELRLNQLRAEQEQLQNHLRALAEQRHQAAGRRRPAEGTSEPGSGPRRERSADELDVTIVPREAPAHVGGGGRPGAREQSVQARAERGRAQVEQRRAQKEADIAATEADRAKIKAQREQEWANQQGDWSRQMQAWSQSEQMQQWQKDMETWQQQMQEWARAQAQRSGRVTGEAHRDAPPAPAAVPPIPPMPAMPPIPAPAPVPAPLQADMDVEVHIPEVHIPHIEPPRIEAPHIAPPMPPEVPEHVEGLEEVQVSRSLTLDPIEGERVLEVANRMGSISVRSGEGPGYKIVATIKGRAETEERARQIAEQAELTSTPSPQGIRVVVTLPESLNEREQHACVVELEVIAPRRVQIRLSQAMGDIRLTGITGYIDAFAQMGSIRARNVAGEVALKTNMGEIDFVAPRELSAKVQANSNFGSIETDLPLEMVTSRHPGMGSTATGVLGDGAGNISLSTNMGSIRVRTQAAESHQTF